MRLEAPPVGVDGAVGVVAGSVKGRGGVRIGGRCSRESCCI